jgi:sugar (pentulose or hexulose) kinase/predicted GIY-YIG superfamily endonuclease
MQPFWIYLLRCADGSYYTGHTDDLEHRIGEHQAGITECYTLSCRPVELVWAQECATRDEALAAERQVKGWSRKKKEAMIRGDWGEVSRLARTKSGHPSTGSGRTDFVDSAALPFTRPACPAGFVPPIGSVRPANSICLINPICPSDPVRPEPVEGQKSPSLSAPSDTCHLGLDFGTSGARACVVDGAGCIVHEARCVTEQTPEGWRTSLHELLMGLPQDLAGRLVSICVDATSATVLLCDAALEPVSPALLYHDARATAEAAELKSLAPPGHTAASATSGLAKFLWLMRHVDLSRAAYFLHQADWLAALLTGLGGISDYHNALKTGYDVERLCWPEWVRALPRAALLPAVVAPGEALAPVSAAVARRFGIAPECQVHAGTTDSIAAFIAAGVSQPGEAVTSLGTTLVLKLLSERRVEAAEFGVYSHRYGDLWLAGGASNAGGGVLRQFFDDAQLAELSARIDPASDSPLDFYPLPSPGERFPINDPTLEPRLSPRSLRPGSGQAPDDAEFLHGLLQGLSRIEAAGYTKLAELGATPLRSVVTAGGGAKNVVWQAMRQRLLGVPVTRAAHGEAAYGAALLAKSGLPST